MIIHHILQQPIHLTKFEQGQLKSIQQLFDKCNPYTTKLTNYPPC